MLRVSVVGFGLLGSSLARALKKVHADDYYIIACNHRQESLDTARELGIADMTTVSVVEAAKEADVFVLATPLSAYEAIIKEAGPYLSSSAIVTDVGSLQHYVAESVMPHLPTSLVSRFVPVHPIAGSEKSGVEAGDAELFYGKRIVVTLPEGVNSEAERTVRQMWEHAGGKIYIMDGKVHDRVYAYVSHIVQIVMICYARAKLDTVSINPEFLRLTHYNDKMWEDIFEANKVYIIEALQAFYDVFLKNCSGPLAHSISHAIMQAVPTSYLEYAGSGYQSVISIDVNEPASMSSDVEKFIKEVERFLLNK